MKMLKNILLRNQNSWLSAGAYSGIFIGVFLLLFSLQTFSDVFILSKGAKDDNILVINKIFEKNYGKPLEFSVEEINEIKTQPFFSDIGVIESNNYKVSLKSKLLGFSTLLFFQSLPVQFLGIDTADFHWKKGEKIPIVLSSDYLALYNYGFAPSQSLPRFSAATIGSLDFSVTVYGNNSFEIFDAVVYDFSPNINSILVPPEFMRYANNKFGNLKEAKGPSQIVANTDNPYNLKLEQFLEAKNLELSRGGLIGGELKSTLFLLSILIMVIGLLILILATLVFVLNFQLIISQSSHQIYLLLLQGYKSSDINNILKKRIYFLFGIVYLSSFILLFISKYIISTKIIEQGYFISQYPNILVLITALLFPVLFLLINNAIIKSNLNKLHKKKV